MKANFALNWSITTLFFITVGSIFSQKIDTLIYSTKKLHSRGFCYENKHLFFANNNGELLSYSLKNGETESLNANDTLPELRDIAILKNKIIAIQSGEIGNLLVHNRKTKQNSKIKIQKSGKDVFLDGIAFECKLGFLMGDPIDGNFSLFYSTDEGSNWKICESELKALEGEAGFAASGSTIQVLNGELIFVSGGTRTRFFRSKDLGKTWEISEIPFTQKDGAGAFSISFKDSKNAVVVGGDYTQSKEKKRTCFHTNDGGKTWTEAIIPPNGYRSCIYYSDVVYYACGTSGIDFSLDNGMNWKSISFNNCFAITSDAKYIYFSSTNGIFLKMKKL
ncbi:MAG: exo-alpha-sialidase [Crocinitomicaceae bacterium]|nr:exo-alpha-sialidase [Crocinitomicaceae bacterium]